MPEQGPTIPRHTPIAEDLFCQNCGYNLRALTGDICPECGGSLAGVRSQVSQIPWVHRKQLGWWRAYWRTVFFVMFRQRQFAEEMARPVSYRDAQLFRWATLATVCTPIAAAGVAFMVLHTPTPVNEPLFNLFWVEGYGILWHVCFVLYVAAATGVPSYFFHPRAVPIRQQNRAVILSYYACAPLAFMALPIALAFAAMVIIHSPANSVGIWLERRAVDVLCELCAGLSAIAVFGGWWLGLNNLARRVLPQTPGRARIVAVCVPALWAGLFAALVVGFPVVILQLGLVVSRFVGSLL